MFLCNNAPRARTILGYPCTLWALSMSKIWRWTDVDIWESSLVSKLWITLVALFYFENISSPINYWYLDIHFCLLWLVIQLYLIMNLIPPLLLLMMIIHLWSKSCFWILCFWHKYVGFYSNSHLFHNKCFSNSYLSLDTAVLVLEKVRTCPSMLCG